ncbi:unnamed protein product [Calypogeia fissa]
MSFGGQNGGRGYGRGPYGVNARGMDRNGGPNSHSSFSARTNPLWAEQMDHDLCFAQEDLFPHLDPLSPSARVHWERCAESRDLLTKIASITSENWKDQEFVECEWEYAEAAYEAKKLKEHVMICYFMDRAPMLQDFREWIDI